MVRIMAGGKVFQEGRSPGTGLVPGQDGAQFTCQHRIKKYLKVKISPILV